MTFITINKMKKTKSRPLRPLRLVRQAHHKKVQDPKAQGKTLRQAQGKTFRRAQGKTLRLAPLTQGKEKIFHFITLFPDMVEGYLSHSILKRAKEDKKLDFKIYNPRDFTKDKRKRIDKRPYGGGPGMVIEAMPIILASEKALGKTLRLAQGKKNRKKVKVIWTSPNGKKFTNIVASNLAKKYDEFIFISGRYEGIDERAKKILKAESYSIGDYVLTGGELPSLVMADAISRQIPGILGDFESVEEKRIASSAVYTRPETFKYKGKNYKVPKVLVEGHHKRIDEWRKLH